MTLDRKAKPFPWRCPKCLGREVRPVTIEYTSRVKHDGRSHEVTVRELVVPRCPACGELVFCNDTEEQISRALRDKLELLQPDEIRSKRKRLGLTQKELGANTDVAPETISRWESGLQIQTRAMNRLLNLIFDGAGARDVPGAGQGASGFAESLANWVTEAPPAPFPYTGLADSETWLSPMAGFQVAETMVFAATVAVQWLIPGDHAAPATTVSESDVGTSLRIAA